MNPETFGKAVRQSAHSPEERIICPRNTEAEKTQNKIRVILLIRQTDTLVITSRIGVLALRLVPSGILMTKYGNDFDISRCCESEWITSMNQ